MRDRHDPQQLLPLSAPVYLVLLALGDRVMHGYGIMRALREETEGREELLPGTLYATIARMVRAGLLEPVAEPPEPGADARRRYYRATPFGRAVARAESARLERLLELARCRHLAAGATRR